MTIIDPVEVMIKYLMSDVALTALLQNRISSRELYGIAGGWVKPDSGMQIRLDGGLPDLYIDTHIARYEFRVWAASSFDAMKVYRRVIEISRLDQRISITTASDGMGLLYTFYQETVPSILFDPDLGLDMLLWFMTAWVAEQAIA